MYSAIEKKNTESPAGIQSYTPDARTKLKKNNIDRRHSTQVQIKITSRDC